MNMNDLNRFAVTFTTAEELLAALPDAFTFCQGKTGDLHMSAPHGDRPGRFVINVVPGLERAQYLVGATLIRLLYAERIPQHYLVVCQAWQNLRDQQWRRERNKL